MLFTPHIVDHLLNFETRMLSIDTIQITFD